MFCHKCGRVIKYDQIDHMEVVHSTRTGRFTTDRFFCKKCVVHDDISEERVAEAVK